MIRALIATAILLLAGQAEAKTVSSVCLKYRIVVTIAGIGIIRCVDYSAPATTPQARRRSDVITGNWA